MVISCSKCNEELKGEHVNSHDYHYEIVALASTDTKENIKQRRAWFDMAIRAKSEYRCFLCKKPAQTAGELRIARIDKQDSYHFWNLAAFCLACIPKDSLLGCIEKQGES